MLRVLAIAFVVLFPLAAQAAKSSGRSRAFVLGIPPLPGVAKSKLEMIETLMVTRLQETGKFQVISQADVAALAGVAEQKQLAGCDTSSCIAEIGGALGAAWLVIGKLGWLGKDLVFTVKLLDVRATRLQKQLSETLPADDRALGEALRVTAYRLLDLEPPRLESSGAAWYRQWWVWTIVGVAVAGGASVGGYFLFRPQQAPLGSLGQVRF